MAEEFRRFGDTALSIPAAGAAAAAALAASLRDRAEAGVLDVVSGFESVLVEFDPDVTGADELADRLRGVAGRPARRAERSHVLPVAFDGPDLEAVGAATGLGADGVRRALLQARLRVAVLGFAPGFAYLGGLEGPLAEVERRPTPRPSVPAGSVAVAGGFAAVYPFASPGGWQLLGRTDVSLFDPDTPPFALLGPGDQVSFTEVAPDALAGAAPAPVRTARRAAGATFVVERAGTATTLQDRGRIGVAHLGVPRAGAADPVASAMANALLGNAAGAACLEVTAAGPRFRCRSQAFVAVVGRGATAAVDGRPVETGRVVPVGAGQLLEVSSTGSDPRAYLAVRGGFDGPVVLGSRATDRLVGLGPGPLVEGDELTAGDAVGPMADHLVPGSVPDRAHRRVLRVLPVGAGTDAPLLGRRYVVDQASDRVGMRLRPEGEPGPAPEVRVRSGPTTNGMVQVPPDGNPIVLLPDHATLGGYPVAGVVISADRGELGRCRPGDEVELSPVDQDEAREAARSLARTLAAAPAGVYPLRAD